MQYTSAFGPTKYSPSRAPAITLTCFGRPTLQGRHSYYKQLNWCSESIHDDNTTPQLF